MQWLKQSLTDASTNEAAGEQLHLLMMSNSEPERALMVMLDLLPALTERELGLLGAGLLEEWIAMNGSKKSSLVKNLAAKNSNFRRALSSVSESRAPLALRALIASLAGSA